MRRNRLPDVVEAIYVRGCRSGSLVQSDEECKIRTSARTRFVMCSSGERLSCIVE